MIDWLTHRRSEMLKILWLLKHTRVTVRDWTEIKILNCSNRKKVFLMQAEYSRNSVVESILKFIGVSRTASAPPLPLLVLPIFFADEERLRNIRGKLKTIISDGNQPFISYHIRLTREYPSLTDVLITIQQGIIRKSRQKKCSAILQWNNNGERCIINRVILYYTCIVLLLFSQMFSSAVFNRSLKVSNRLRVKIDQGLSISWASFIGDQFPILPILPLRMDFE